MCQSPETKIALTNPQDRQESPERIRLRFQFLSLSPPILAFKAAPALSHLRTGCFPGSSAHTPCTHSKPCLPHSALQFHSPSSISVYILLVAQDPALSCLPPKATLATPSPRAPPSSWVTRLCCLLCAPWPWLGHSYATEVKVCIPHLVRTSNPVGNCPCRLQCSQQNRTQRVNQPSGGLTPLGTIFKINKQ